MRLEEGLGHAGQRLLVVGSQRTAGALYDDGFQALRAHDSADAIVSGDMTPITHKGGKTDEILARRSDAKDTELAFIDSQLLGQEIDHLPGVHSGQVLSVSQFRLAIGDMEILEARGRALDDHTVKAIEAACRPPGIHWPGKRPLRSSWDLW